MGGFNNVLQNNVLPILRKYSADIPTLLSFIKISESKLSTIEAYLPSMENSLKDWSMEISTTKSTSEYVSQQHDLLSSSILQLQQRVDQVQQTIGPLSASISEIRSQNNSLQSLSSSVHTLSLRMDSMVHSFVERRPMVLAGVAAVTNRKRGGGLHPARPHWWPPTKRPRATPGGLFAASVTACHAGRVCPRACARPLLWADP